MVTFATTKHVGENIGKMLIMYMLQNENIGKMLIMYMLQNENSGETNSKITSLKTVRP